MIKVVLDTNVLVSALLSPSGGPARVLDHVLNGDVVLCYDSNIIAEYKEVLARPKFGFNHKAIEQIMDFISQSGYSVVPRPLPLDMVHEDDRVLFEVAVHVRGYLVTGNTKHYPREPFVVTATEFLRHRGRFFLSETQGDYGSGEEPD